LLFKESKNIALPNKNVNKEKYQNEKQLQQLLRYYLNNKKLNAKTEQSCKTIKEKRRPNFEEESKPSNSLLNEDTKIWLKKITNFQYKIKK